MINEFPLRNKKIILFCPKFFGYEKEIVSVLKKMGAEVTSRSGQASEHPWSKAFIRLLPRLAWYYTDQLHFSWLKKFSPDNCDLVLIVKGEGLSPKFLKALRIHYPKAYIVLYLFDSILNCKYIELKYPYIDEFFSFDPDDCNQMPMFKYRPLFFIEKYLETDSGQQNQRLFFLGTLNGDRPKLICRLLAVLNHDVVFDYWLFVRSRLEFVLRKIFDHSVTILDSSRFLFNVIPSETIISHLDKCVAVLDIEHPKQTGLTMRTFEVLASRKKLITTNKTILQHDFYNPKRICVIDRNNPSIPPDFLISKVPPLPDDFMTKYSLSGWLMEILNTFMMIKTVEDSKGS